MKNEEEKKEEEKKEEEVKVEESKPKKKPVKRKKKEVEGAEAAQEEDLVNIYYFNEPTRVQDLWSDDDPAK